MDRRRFVELGVLAAAAVPSGCVQRPTEVWGGGEAGRLSARWHTPALVLEPGLHPLGFHPYRDGFIRIPSGYRPEMEAPFTVLLHGAGGSAEDWSSAFGLFDELGMVALGLNSESSSWDLRYGGFGRDLAILDAALFRVFEEVRVDPTRLAVSGFSDGASYSVSLGLINGDLFTHVLAFSPGFAVLHPRHGSPRVFLGHGVLDTVLPVSFTRHLADVLRTDGYEVRYEEFNEGHIVPRTVAAQAFGWVAG